MGSADGASPDAVASQFEFISGVSPSYDSTQIVWEDTSATSDANASVGQTVTDSNVPFVAGQAVTVKIPDGFTYINGQKYDIHIRITPDTTEANPVWHSDFFERHNTPYMNLSPKWEAKSTYGYTYEIWLTNGSTANTTAPQDIVLVGGSCYMANNERCRPYSDDGLIYTKVAKEDLKWSASDQAWIVTNKSVNDKADHYVLGHGTELIGGNAVFKGYYKRINYSGQSEIVLGYLDYQIGVDKETTTTPADPDGYVAGETIEYTVSVTNKGINTLTNVDVTDDLTNIEFVSVSYSTGAEHALTPAAEGNKWTIDQLAGSETATFTFKYTVTAEDVAATKVLNGAKAVGHYMDGQEEKTVEDDDDVEDPTTEVKTPAISVTKETTSTPADTDGYVEDEYIEYKVDVTNTGNVALTPVELTDDLAGVEYVGVSYSTGAAHTLTPGENGVWTIDTLAVGEVATFTFKYKVTAADVDATKVVNGVKAVGHYGETTVEDTDQVEDPTTQKKVPSISVDKETTSTSEDTDGYVVDEYIEYKVDVTNTGNVTLSPVELTDDLANVEYVSVSYSTGAEHKLTPASEGNKWTIDSLAAGEVATFVFKYKVTQDDVTAGKVVNGVKATGKYGEQTVEDTDQVEDPTTEKKVPAISVDKETTSTSADSDGYVVDEYIEYKVDVTNTGNVALTPVELTDDLSGVEFVSVSYSTGAEHTLTPGENGVWTIDTLAVGEVASFTFKYKVTGEDVAAGKVVNGVKAVGHYGEKTVKDDDEVNDPTTQKKEPSISVDKETTSTSADSKGYVKDEYIEYKVDVTNTGNVTLSPVELTDDLSGVEFVSVSYSTGTAHTLNSEGNKWTIDSLAAGEVASFTFKYKVTADDVTAGKVVNGVKATGKYGDQTVEDTDQVEDPTTKPSEPENPDTPDTPDTPSNPSTPSTPKQTTKKSLPKTGDDSGIFAAIAAVAGVSIIAVGAVLKHRFNR